NSGNNITDTIAVLPAGASTNITIPVRVNSNVPAGTLSNGTVVISSTTTDPTPGNNNNSGSPVLTTVTNSADLSMAIAGTTNPFPGSNVTYTLTVTNIAGSSDAQNVTVSDPLPVLPAGTSLVSATVLSGG